MFRHVGFNTGLRDFLTTLIYLGQIEQRSQFSSEIDVNLVEIENSLLLDKQLCTLHVVRNVLHQSFPFFWRENMFPELSDLLKVVVVGSVVPIDIANQLLAVLLATVVRFAFVE